MSQEKLLACVEQLRAALSERQTTLASALEGSRARRAGALETQLQEKRSLLEDAGLVTYTHELLKESDQPCFVQAGRVTHYR